MNMPVGTTITEEQLELRPSQRAMIAARLANVPRGFGARKLTPDAITNGMAAKLLNVNAKTVVRAKMVLRYATPEIIKAVESGRIGLHSASAGLVQPPSCQDNMSVTGKNPARIERQRQDCLVWKHLREAVLALSVLPQAADVLAIAKRMDRRHKTILPKVPGALTWLKELADVCHGEAALEVAGEEAAAGSGEV